MPIYNFECTNCRRPRRRVQHKAILITGDCAKLEKPCQCGNPRFVKTLNEPSARTPGSWR